MAEDSVKFKISRKQARSFQHNMLQWYDKHKRPIPWRTSDGNMPDPYRIWLSEIMCQQTTVQAVIPYFIHFTKRWPSVQDLAAAPREDIMDAWAGLGYYSRARNLHKCAQAIVQDYEGTFPQSQKKLKGLPGIGDYTSAAIMSMAFNSPATVVDGNIERIMARYFNIQTPLPKAKTEMKQAASLFFTSDTPRPGCFAQSLMDLGAMVCMPKSPKCDICPVAGGCKARPKNIAAELPRKSARKIKPHKSGYIYWISNENGEILVERRPDKAMLGGTIGLPTSQWGALDQITHLQNTAWPVGDGLKVQHSFTHFDLTLYLYKAHNTNPIIEQDGDYYWVARKEIEKTKLPTVFQKALKVFLKAA